MVWVIVSGEVSERQGNLQLSSRVGCSSQSSRRCMNRSKVSADHCLRPRLLARRCGVGGVCSGDKQSIARATLKVLSAIANISVASAKEVLANVDWSVTTALPLNRKGTSGNGSFHFCVVSVSMH